MELLCEQIWRAPKDRVFHSWNHLWPRLDTAFDRRCLEIVRWVLEAHEHAPSEIILDLDATDDPAHGEQEGRFFHGYYDCYSVLGTGI